MAQYPTVTYPIGRAVNVNVGVGMHDLTSIINGNGFTGNSIAARAGGGRPLATPIAQAMTLIATVATANDSVALPPGVGGQILWVVNGTATSAQIFAANGTSDTINGVAAATGIALAGGKAMTLVCPIAGAWFGVLSA